MRTVLWVGMLIGFLVGPTAARPVFTELHGGAVAPAGQPTAPAAREAAVEEFEVNGLKVLVKQRDASPTVVAALFLRGGAANVTAREAGVEALMLDVATEATENFPLERFRRELSTTGTKIGSSVGFDYAALTLNSTRSYFDRSWDLFVDAALHPSFDPADVERVRRRLIAAIGASEDNPDSYLQVLQARTAFAGHPYANDPNGSAESMRSLSVDDLKRYHQQAFQTSRLLLVVVGDVEPADVRRKVEASFGRLPRGEFQPTASPRFDFSSPSLEVTARPLRTNYVQGIYAAPDLASPDYAAMRVATAILQSRVYEEVRVRRNLSYAPDAFLWNRAANAGGIYVTADDANRAVAVMLEEIEHLKQQPVSGRELAAVAQNFLTQHYMREQTNSAQAGIMAQYELVGGGWRNADRFLERVEAVTPADVQRVANTYMRNLQFVVLGNPSRIDREVFVGR